MQMIAAPAFLAKRAAQPDLEVLDVRTEEEVKALRLAGDVYYLPLDCIEAAAVRALRKKPDEDLYLLCRTANRSRMAAQILEDQGARNLVVVQGGIEACAALGAPMLRGA